MTLPDPFIGRQLGDYRIIGVIGRGGMASVYRGYDVHLQRYAAVKVIGAHLVTDDDHEDYRQRFIREARAIARLNHPNIVSVYQFGEIDGLYYMAMVLIEGRNLSQIMKEQAAAGHLLPRQQVARIIRDIAAALDFAHASGVIHRDVKPSNIMITSDGQAILTDFGLALSASEGTIGNTFGSAHYMAPEQAVSSAAVVPQSDIYSLGVVMYQLLTGRVPFDDPSPMSVALKHINEAPPSPRRYNPALTSEVERVLLRALEKKPQDRFPTGEAMASALTRALNGAGVGASAVPDWDDETPLDDLDLEQLSTAYAPTRPTLSRMKRVKRRRIVTWAALLVILIVIGALIAVPQFASAPGTGAPGTAVPGSAVPISSETPAPSQTATPLLVAQVESVTPSRTPTWTASATSTRTASPTRSMTSTRTATRTSTQTRTITTAPTSTRTTTPTSSPTALPTITVTPRPTLTPVPPLPTQTATDDTSAAPLLLTYDQAFVLLNRSDSTVFISDLSFVQTLPDGRTRRFEAARWSGGIQGAGVLPAGDCFLIWGLFDDEPPLPRECASRQAWQIVGEIRQFWRGDAPGAIFEVRRGDTVLARCPIEARQCVVALS
jgi:serine/threonine protein kinase